MSNNFVCTFGETWGWTIRVSELKISEVVDFCSSVVGFWLDDVGNMFNDVPNGIPKTIAEPFKKGVFPAIFSILAKVFDL